MKVRDAIRRIECRWLRLRNTEGSHRQYIHRQYIHRKSGKVTIAGHPSLDLPTGVLRGILKQAGLKP